MDLSYNYDRLASKGSLNGKTGNLTHIVDNLDRNKDRKYEYDTLGRLTKSLGGASAGGTGATANWTQNYTYDRYGNKKATTKSGITANSQAVPLDGLASQAYAATTNRITTSGHEYDHSGNMTRGKAPDGSLQRFEYDAAGRLLKIKTDAGALLEEYTYGASRERIKKTVANGDKTYYAWGGSSVIAEYTEAAAATTMSWAKSYVYAGSRLLSTITKNGAAETTEYHHPDRLGTKLVTNTSLNTAKSQATLPFGTAISSETTATTNQKFTSYDRSGATGLDYAVNRTYNSGQSRFTQIDPIGMASASIGNPQSMNLFAYTQNNPVDFVDPSGLDAWVEVCTVNTFIGGSWDGGGFYPDGRFSQTTVCIRETYRYDPIAPPVDHGGGGGGGKLLAPLKPNKESAFNNALGELQKRLEQSKIGKDCKEKVLDKLSNIKGFTLKKFTEFLSMGAALYNGLKSTALASDYHGAGKSFFNGTIAEYFKKNRGAQALVGTGSKVTNFTVFFRPNVIETKAKRSAISGAKISGLTTSNLALAFHEALHGFGQSTGDINGFYDHQIQEAFGLPAEASGNISDYIEKHCIKGVKK